jgi:putative transcriptional regulator
MDKRNIFDELMQGVNEMAASREGKITLRSHRVEPVRLPKVTAKTIRRVRQSLNCSRSVFARSLHINERTLEKWEQGRAKPNRQAGALILLVGQYPDTLQRLADLAVR